MTNRRTLVPLWRQQRDLFHPFDCYRIYWRKKLTYDGSGRARAHAESGSLLCQLANVIEDRSGAGGGKPIPFDKHAPPGSARVSLPPVASISNAPPHT
jgi:hypothetical protein